MHEKTIANGIITEASKHGDVKAITIEVGDLAHLTAEELKEAMSDLVKWKIKIIKKKAIVECSCGYRGEPKIVEKRHGYVLFVCPVCGAVPKVVEGGDIVIKEVVVK